MNKLTDEQKAEIMFLKGSESSYKVAKQYGVSHVAIWKIWNPEKKNNTLDTIILKKLIPEFIKANINLSLQDREIKRIQELYAEI